MKKFFHFGNFKYLLLLAFFDFYLDLFFKQLYDIIILYNPKI
jgi:hypothetical protein